MLTYCTYPSYQSDFNNAQMHFSPDLLQGWQQDDFSNMLAMQIEILKPQGKVPFKYPSVEASELECFVDVC